MNLFWRSIGKRHIPSIEVMDEDGLGLQWLKHLGQFIARLIGYKSATSALSPASLLLDESAGALVQDAMLPEGKEVEVAASLDENYFP